MSEVTITMSRDTARGVLAMVGVVIELLSQSTGEPRAAMARLGSAEFDRYGLGEARDAIQIALSTA
jgi:hypothetical protein